MSCRAARTGRARRAARARGSTTTPAGSPATRTWPAITSATTALPPWNDSYRYVFTLYALDIARCPVEGKFTGQQVRAAIQGHILAEAGITGVYTLNPGVKL
jgi:phosphatidylethanolamine-binding protein (PEBP) family uncharacterized protein